MDEEERNLLYARSQVLRCIVEEEGIESERGLAFPLTEFGAYVVEVTHEEGEEKDAYLVLTLDGQSLFIDGLDGVDALLADLHTAREALSNLLFDAKGELRLRDTVADGAWLREG